MTDSNTPLDPVAKADLAKFISETHRAQFDERRRHEFQTLFVTLAFYGLCAAAALSEENRLPKDVPLGLYALLVFLFVAVVTSLRLAAMHHAGNKNKSFAENAEDFICRHLSGEATAIDRCDVFTLREKYWTAWRPVVYTKKPSGHRQARIGLVVWVAQTLLLFAFAAVAAFVVRWGQPPIG